MTRLGFCSCALALCSTTALAQTNACGSSRALFQLPRLQLRALDCETVSAPASEAPRLEQITPKPILASPERDAASTAPKLGAPITTSGMELSSREGIADTFEKLDFYRRLDEGGYLTRPERPSGTIFERVIVSTFTPEVIHFGKTTLSCSLITAIKRKNLLCLLNPIFLQFTW